MVAETIESTTETPVTDLPDAEPTGDAGETPAADAAEADVDAYLASRSQGKEGGESATEPDAGGELPELKEAREAAAAAAREEARQEAREEAEAARRQAQAEQQVREEQQRFNAAYNQRGREAYQEAYDAAIELGMSEAEAQQRGNRAFQRFNSHHADSLKLSLPQAQAAASQAARDAFNNGAMEVLGKELADAFFGTPDSPRTYRTQAEALKAFRDVVRQGYVTEAQAVAREKQAILRYRRDLEAEGIISGAASGTTVQGRGPGRSDDELLLDPSTPINTINEILARRAGQ